MKQRRKLQELSPTSQNCPNLKDLQVRLIPIDNLIPDARNARTHHESQVAGLVASIREFGWTNPILVRPDQVIIAGHGRLLAARILGLTAVPVIELTGLSEAQCRALALADNQLALNAGWDEGLLRSELAALQLQNFDLDVIGFNANELARLLEEQKEGAGWIDPDAIPIAAKAAISAPGDLWLLGDHRLLCGDGLNQAAIDVVLGGSRTHMVFTEPGHLMTYAGEAADKPTIDDDSEEETSPDFLRAACARLLQACDGALYICAPSSDLHALQQAFREAGGHWSANLIWVQPHITGGHSDYRRQYESILYGWREGSKPYWCGADDQSDVWTLLPAMAHEDHPVVKPVELVERALENSSRRGETILDPFANCGTTLIACERRERKACLVERNPQSVDVICKRWERYCGKPAIRYADGARYADLESEQAA